MMTKAMTKAPNWKILSRSLVAFMDNDLTASSAAVSYFSMLALFPTLILLLAFGNRLVGPEAVETYLIGQVLQFLPGTHAFVRKNLEYMTEVSPSLILSCFFVLVWAGSWLVTVIEKALNRIWCTDPRPFLRGRAVNFALMGIVFVLLALSAVVAAIIAAVRSAADTIPLNVGPELAALSGFAWQIIFFVVSVMLTIILFTILYYWLPNTDVTVREALTGAAITGILWEAAKFGFAYLIPYFHYDLLYGSIGAGVALLSWVYISSVIMLFGAQFTALLHREHLFNALDKSLKPAIKAFRETGG